MNLKQSEHCTTVTGIYPIEIILKSIRKVFFGCFHELYSPFDVQNQSDIDTFVYFLFSLVSQCTTLGNSAAGFIQAIIPCNLVSFCYLAPLASSLEPVILFPTRVQSQRTETVAYESTLTISYFINDLN